MTCANCSTPHGIASYRLRAHISQGHDSDTCPASWRRKLPRTEVYDRELASLGLPVASFSSVGWTASELWQDASDDLRDQRLASVDLHFSTKRAHEGPSVCTGSTSCRSRDAIWTPLQPGPTVKLWINGPQLASDDLQIGKPTRRMTCKLASDGLLP